MKVGVQFLVLKVLVKNKGAARITEILAAAQGLIILAQRKGNFQRLFLR
jgi:hypothetical protein